MSQPIPSLDFDLGDSADLIRDWVEKFAACEIAPRAAQIDVEDNFPADLWRKMGAAGLLGVTVDEQYGGTHLGYLEHVVAMEEISRAPRPLAFPMAHIPTFASVSSIARERRRKNSGICQS